MADRTILEFATILGVNVHMDNDYIPIVNAAGATLTDKNRKITPREFLRLAISVSGMVSLMANFDASVDAYPSTGGTGDSGAILKGNAFPVSVFGEVPGDDEPQSVPVGTLLIALVDTPGQTPGNWRIL